MSDLQPTPPSATSQLMFRLIPKVGQTLATFRAERHEERLRAFLDQSFHGLEVDQIVMEVDANLEFADDLDRAMQAAATTSSKAKIRLLARILRNELAAKDRAAIDDVQQVLRVAIELDPVDIRTLACISQDPGKRPFTAVRDHLGGTDATAHAVESRLVRLGLVRSETQAAVADPTDQDKDEVYMDMSWSTTPLFHALILILNEETPPPDSDS